MNPQIYNSLGSNYNQIFIDQCEALIKHTIDLSSAEKKLVNYCENKFSGKAILLGKGRQAINYALRSANIGKSDSVLLQANTCYAVYSGVKSTGAYPRFVDTEKLSLNLNLSTIKAAHKIADNPRALIVQHNLGYCVSDMKNIRRWCTNNQIILIEDLAHAVGGKSENGTPLGTYADIIILSFGQDKIWDALTGGCCLIKNKDLIADVKVKHNSISHSKLRKHLLYPKLTRFIRLALEYGFVGKIADKCIRLLHLLPRPVEGSNSEPEVISPEIAYLALFQARRLKQFCAHRRKIARIYDRHISKGKKIVNLENIKYSANLRYPLLVKDADKFKKMAKQYGLHIFDTWYDAPVAPIRYLPLVQEYVLTSYPNAEYVTDHLINLPTHIQVTPKIAKQIADLINMLVE